MTITSEPRAVRLSCAEAAALIGVSPRTLEAWRRNRIGPPFFHPRPGRPFYLASDITDWLAASRVRTYPARSP